MKKLLLLAAVAAMVMGAQALTIVEVRQAAPGTPDISGESLEKYDCFLIKNSTLKSAMGGELPEVSQSGVDAVAAFLNADFSTRYSGLLQPSFYDMVRDSTTGHLDFRNSSGTNFKDYFGVLVYNPVSGKTEDVDGINYFRVFNMSDKTTINDASGTGYWSGWTSVTAVPEPTSGLLLLLGVAGLALRRKQK